jgi:hypothetical protein
MKEKNKMAYERVLDLECDTTVSLGGRNKKTGKANPTEVEGYYLGSKEVANKMSKNGKSSLYIFETSNGKIGVWGKTHLDKLMSRAPIGAMTKVVQSGTTRLPTGDMYKFTLDIDRTNTIELGSQTSESGSTVSLEDGMAHTEETMEDDSEENEYQDEMVVEQPTAPARPSVAASPEQQARARALLSSRTKARTVAA